MSLFDYVVGGKLDKLNDVFKKEDKNKNEFFEIVDNISFGKRDVDVRVYHNYNQFTINRYFSKFSDCLSVVSLFNHENVKVSDQAHYDYLVAEIPKRKRYADKNPVLCDEGICDLILINKIRDVFNLSEQESRAIVETRLNKSDLNQVRHQLFPVISDEDIKKSCGGDNAKFKKLKKMICKWNY